MDIMNIVNLGAGLTALGILWYFLATQVAAAARKHSRLHLGAGLVVLISTVAMAVGSIIGVAGLVALVVSDIATLV